MLNQPKVILADEPTGNLDPETGHNIVALLHEICKSQNTAVVMSTHNLKFIEEFPGRVIKVEDRDLKEESDREASELKDPDSSELTPETQIDQECGSSDNNMS